MLRIQRNNRQNYAVQNYILQYRRILDEMIRGMTTAELSESISYNFIVQMIPHHCAAIEMSQNILQYTAAPAVITIAERIIEEQRKSIADMEEILCSCKECTNCPGDFIAYQNTVNCIMHTMFCQMNNAPVTNNLNVDFMQEMIPHHEGAVRMSKNALDYSLCPALVPILKAIIDTQEKGIAQMKQLLCYNTAS